MIGPIDPTGRADRHTNRKLVRLLGLLGGVFVVGAGLGWIIGQISAPAIDAGAQKAATTLPVSVAQAPPMAPSDTSGTDTLAQPAPQPPAPQLPAPEATSAPLAPPTPAVATPPAAVAAGVRPAASAPVPPASAPSAPVATLAAPAASASLDQAPVAAAKPAPVVVIEPAVEVPPAPAAVPRKPAVQRATRPAHHHRNVAAEPVRHHHAHQPAETPAVTVFGAKAAPAGSHWVVQLGAFRAHDHAAMLVMTLQSHGTAAHVVTRDDGAKGIWYVVRTPSLPSLAQAQARARAIAGREHVAASVLRAE